MHLMSRLKEYGRLSTPRLAEVACRKADRSECSRPATRITIWNRSENFERALSSTSPWQWARAAGPFVLSIKSECLERMIFFGSRRFRRAVGEYVAHYNCERHHQGIDAVRFLGAFALGSAASGHTSDSADSSGTTAGRLPDHEPAPTAEGGRGCAFGHYGALKAVLVGPVKGRDLSRS